MTHNRRCFVKYIKASQKGDVCGKIILNIKKEKRKEGRKE